MLIFNKCFSSGKSASFIRSVRRRTFLSHISEITSCIYGTLQIAASCSFITCAVPKTIDSYRNGPIQIIRSLADHLQSSRGRTDINNLGKSQITGISICMERMLYGRSRHLRSLLFQIDGHRQRKGGSCNRRHRSMEGYFVKTRVLYYDTSAVLRMGNRTSAYCSVPVKNQRISCRTALRRRGICRNQLRCRISAVCTGCSCGACCSGNSCRAGRSRRASRTRYARRTCCSCHSYGAGRSRRASRTRYARRACYSCHSYGARRSRRACCSRHSRGSRDPCRARRSCHSCRACCSGDPCGAGRSGGSS